MARSKNYSDTTEVCCLMGMQNENVRMQDWDFINASYTSGNATNLAPDL